MPSTMLQTSSAVTEHERRPTWLELHGSEDWDGLLYPLVDPSLRAQILVYVLFAQAAYDAYDVDPASGSVPYDPASFFDELSLRGCGYEVTRYLYATMDELPRPSPLALKLFPRLNRRLKRLLRLETWSEDSNWMGYVAVSDVDEEESRRRLGGRRNILAAWRGTVKASEWFKDAQWRLEHLADKSTGGSDAMVEHGFKSIYTTNSRCGKFTKSSASEQVKAEIRRLVDAYGGEDGKEVTLTVTGHSLGGALALLSACDAAASIPGLGHVSVVSFGAPQVGDAAFTKELAGNGVKVLRVVNKEDDVPKLPSLVDSRYHHAGAELELAMDGGWRPGFLYDVGHANAAHSLKTYQQLLQPAEATPASTTTPCS